MRQTYLNISQEPQTKKKQSHYCFKSIYILEMYINIYGFVWKLYEIGAQIHHCKHNIHISTTNGAKPQTALHMARHTAFFNPYMPFIRYKPTHIVYIDMPHLHIYTPQYLVY